MFVWKTSKIIKAIGRFLLDLQRRLLQIRRALGTDREEEIVGMDLSGASECLHRLRRWKRRKRSWSFRGL
jgi:hypothetical protein